MQFFFLKLKRSLLLVKCSSYWSINTSTVESNYYFELEKKYWTHATVTVTFVWAFFSVGTPGVSWSSFRSFFFFPFTYSGFFFNSFWPQTNLNRFGWTEISFILRGFSKVSSEHCLGQKPYSFFKFTLKLNHFVRISVRTFSYQK